MQSQMRRLFQQRRCLTVASNHSRHQLMRTYAVRIDKSGSPKKKPIPANAKMVPKAQQQTAKQQKQQTTQIQTSKEKQAENIRALLRVITSLEQQELEQMEEQFQQQQQFPGEAFNQQIQVNSADANYMITYAMFRYLAAYKYWTLDSSISTIVDPDKSMEEAKCILRLFTDSKRYKDYLRFDSEKQELGDSLRCENLANLLSCLELNDKYQTETDPEVKKQIQDEMYQSPYVSLVQYIPKEVISILIDERSDSEFRLHKQYFKTIINFHQILRVESALHTLRLWALPENARDNYDNSTYIEDEDTVEEPIHLLYNHPKYFVIANESKTGWMTTNNEYDPNPSNLYVPVFTGPDLAFDYADSREIPHSRVKTVSGQKLFNVLNDKYDKIEGVFFNIGNKQSFAVNYELALSRDFVRDAVAVVQE
jgi:hypothetical protein